jgi:hypothetical protein
VISLFGKAGDETHWLGRISRPDIMVAINTFANDDKRAARLVGYIVLPPLITLIVMRINDPPAKLWSSQPRGLSLDQLQRLSLWP